MNESVNESKPSDKMTLHYVTQYPNSEPDPSKQSQFLR